MKDEFDDVTPDMFKERIGGKKVSRPVSPEIKSMIEAEKGSTTAEKVKNLQSKSQPGGQLNPLNLIISRLDEEGNRPAKAPAKPVPRSGGGGGGIPKVGDKRTPEFKKGGKVSSASSRADGCATKGKTKGRFV